MKIKIERAEIVFTVISLLFFTKGLESILPGSIISVIRYASLSVSCVALIYHAGRMLWVINQQWLFLSVLLLENFSFLWSDFPGLTLFEIRSEMLPMTMFGIYLATRFTLRRQIELLTYALTLAILLSFVVTLGAPSIGISPEGIFRGIYNHKNVTSAYGVLAALSFYSLTLSKESGGLKAWIGFGLSIAFILATTSKTGLVLSLFLPSAMFLYSKLYLRGNFAVILSSLTILVVGTTSILVIENWNFLLSSIGGDPTLTGRTPMWAFMLNKIYQRPWLGYGRNAFWAPQTNNSVAVGETVTQIDFAVYHAHNGFIELMLDIGLIGGLAFLVSFLKMYLTAAKRASLAIEPDDIWPLGFLLFLTINNMTESFLTWNLNLFWVLCTSLTFSINRRSKAV